jgi:hypothetical protein
LNKDCLVFRGVEGAAEAIGYVYLGTDLRDVILPSLVPECTQGLVIAKQVFAVGKAGCRVIKGKIVLTGDQRARQRVPEGFGENGLGRGEVFRELEGV